MQRGHYEAEHTAFAEAVRTFLDKEVVPHYLDWERDGITPREVFTAAGRQGFLGMAIPERYGGGGAADFRFNQALGEQVAYAGVTGTGLGITLHNDICLPYFLAYCSDEQRDRWLPGIASGALITAVAMTEPGAGSDLSGIRTSAVRSSPSDDHYVVNGAKTFITNGVNADLVITAVRSFNDVRVPVANRLGEEGAGFGQLVANLPQERLSIAIAGLAAARAAFEQTVAYVRERHAFGTSIGMFQNTRFVLAEIATEIDVAQAFVDKCVLALNAGDLTVEDAAKAKWWCTELQGRVVDRCVQLNGGYGYMLEYSIARAFADARVTRIDAGATEIMKEIIGRSLPL